MKSLHFKIILLIYLIILGNISAFAKERPKWITEIPSDNRYIYTVGIKTNASTIEDDKRSAANQAIAELITRFGIKSKAQFNEKKTEIETKVSDEFASKTGEINIKGTYIKDWYFEKTEDGRYNVFVLLQYPKEELEKENARISRESAERMFLIDKALKKGLDAEKAGRIKDAFELYLSALNLITEDEDNRRPEAVNRLNNIVQKTRLIIVSGNKQKIKSFQNIENPLIVKVVFDDVTAMPVSNVPVSFDFSEGSGELIKETFTNKDGEAGTEVTKIKPSSNNVSIKAVISAEQWLTTPSSLSQSARNTASALIEKLSSKNVTFQLSPTDVAKKKERVAVLIDEKNLGTELDEGIISSEIISSLKDYGYRIVADFELGKKNSEKIRLAFKKDELWSLDIAFYKLTDIVIGGSINTKQYNKTPEGIFVAEAEAFIKAVYTQNGEVAAKKKVVGERGFGLTPEQAGIDAIKNVGKIIAESIIEQLLSEKETTTPLYPPLPRGELKGGEEEKK